MFRIAEGPSRTFWVAANGAATYYVGQLLSFNTTTVGAINGAVIPIVVPNGAADTSNKQVIAGIVIGFNNRNQISNATGQYEIGVVTQATQLARDWMGQEGMYAKGDPQMLVQIAEILPDTVIEGDIRNAAVGTATTLLTATAGSTDGGVTAITTNAVEHTPVTLTGTIYCRSGANAGLYRVNKNTVTTAPSVTTAFPRNIAIGDTFVQVPFKQGFTTAYIDGPGLYLSTAVGPGTATNFHLIVYKLDLSVALKETAHFRFANCHFDAART